MRSEGEICEAGWEKKGMARFGKDREVKNMKIED